MKKKVAKFSILPILSGALFFSFSTKEAANLEGYATSSLELLEYTVPNTEEMPEASLEVLKATPKLGKSYIGFKEALGFKESRGNYKIINQYGYMGKYQFGKGTLKLIGVYDTQLFLDSPALQEAAFYANASRNKWILKRDIKRFVGKRINGILITESGILAAAHLAGPGSVKKYLRSWGATAFSDAFGTTIGYYMKKFSGYDTSFVQPERKAKAIIAIS
ncbi:hypothetical protein JM83_0288 [Gillisia sp. Hel_I_86]|uniref:peptidoglycan-binding protein LysM n=1 Tax=Gillisia sp. Hel_I_86 TaxID=1249981 RepID=UPI00119C1E7E|nr:peptidoglycan-binding protein LysM [Gillisia sp. Hel_I_86]TVZ25382.1 hypothetical protein JM83_0288 [Gillisia sp. Hel_I_86]